MNNLLSAHFARLWRSKTFWLCAAFMVGYAVLCQIQNYFDFAAYGVASSLENALYGYIVFYGIIQSIFTSLFIGTEYSDGTLRNKLVVGHSRLAVYVSLWILSASAGLILCLLSLFFGILVGLPLLNGFQSSAQDILCLLLGHLGLIIAYSSIFTLIALLCQNKAASAVISLLLAFILLFVGVYISAKLSEPPVYSNVYMTETGVTEEEVPNPNYLEGTTREVYEFLYDCIPGGQTLQLTSSSQLPSPFWPLPLYSLFIGGICTGLGIWIFYRKDIR